MTGPPDRLGDRPLRAPQEDGGVLIEPDDSAIDRIVEENIGSAAGYDVDLGGATLRELASSARSEMFDAARAYTSRYRDTLWLASRNAGRLFLVGHQPEMFHPGVWLKNVALDRWSRRHGGAGIHLLIDNDVPAAPTLRVPAGSVDDPRIENIAFDHVGDPVSWEERKVIDRATLASFGTRAADALRPLLSDPMMCTYWPKVLSAHQTNSNLGQCLAQARHCVEGDWGLETLELPLSTVCETEAFHLFAAFLLAELPRFVEVHNTALAAYRRAHRVRSQSHPVPELERRGAWLESPLWFWTAGNRRRRPLFLSRKASAWLIGEPGGEQFDIPATRGGDNRLLATGLSQLSASGFKIRPRALITTMFIRLFLSDLFIHGIGGAKYDRLTDRIAQQFLEISPPQFAVVSGTRLLPVARTEIRPEDLRNVEQELRRLEFHPEEFVSEATLQTNTKARRLVAEKKRSLALPASGDQRRARHLAIEQANAALLPLVASIGDRLRATREQMRRQLRRNEVLASRDYAFCLYPQNILRRWLLDEALPAS